MMPAAAGLVALLQERIVTLTADHGVARFGLAVSGGPDSMALLHLASIAFPKRISAATMDHGLRTTSAGEAAMVARWCADHGIEHEILYPDAPVEGNVQAWARRQRYKALDDWMSREGLDWLLTAHHADDQLETLLMRLNRGSGVGGLAGIRLRVGRVVRPLLDIGKLDLLEVARAAQIPFVEDPSNVDSRFDRAALRGKLQEIDWIDRSAAARSAAALAEADHALDWTAGQLAQSHLTQDEEGLILDRTDLPREILRRLVLMMVRCVGEKVPRGPTLDSAISAAQRGKRASIGSWMLVGGPVWRLVRSPLRTIDTERFHEPPR